MNSFVSILWLIFSIIMLVGGFVGCFIPLEVFASFVIFLPFVLIISGLCGIFYYFSVKEFSGANFILLDAILNLLFALIFLASGVEFTSLSVVMIVAFMALFKGILGLFYTFKFKRSGFSEWSWMLVVSILNIFVAVIFILYPQIGGITIGFMISFLVFFFALVNIFAFISIKKFFNN